MRNLVIFLFLSTTFLSAQTALDAPLPEPLNKLSTGIQANHFPSPVYASEDKSQNDFKYFWKHNTAVLATSSDIQITECGAYIFYNEQWNLRVKYTAKDFAKLFNCPKGKLKQGQVYTFPDNWRTDNRLFGGWAMWYFIGTNADGEEVCGYAKLETKGALIDGKQSLQLNSAKSTLNWKGYAALSSYALGGTLKAKKGELVFKEEQVVQSTLQIDMNSLQAEIKDLENHLKKKDFFEVQKYPEAQFVMNQPTSFKEGPCTLNGNLTIKSTTEPVQIKGQFEPTTNGWKYVGQIRVDRTRFGITYNSQSFFKNLGEHAIADHFDLEFELYFEQ